MTSITPETWLALNDRLFGPHVMARAAQEVSDLLELTHTGPGARVLDMPCGNGRHSTALAERGMRVTGVDLTRPFIDHAEARARHAGVHVEFVQADMREFARPAAFDLALNLWTSLGYFVDQADDRRVLARLYDSLVPEGRIVLEMLPKEVLLRSFAERDWRREADGVIVIEERTLAPGLDWIDNVWTFLLPEGPRTVNFGHRLYSGAELRLLLLDAGFTDVRLYGSLAGTPFDLKAQRLVVTARKPEKRT